MLKKSLQGGVVTGNEQRLKKYKMKKKSFLDDYSTRQLGKPMFMESI